jgi:hypothetical protein
MATEVAVVDDGFSELKIGPLHGISLLVMPTAFSQGRSAV